MFLAHPQRRVAKNISGDSDILGCVGGDAGRRATWSSEYSLLRKLTRCARNPQRVVLLIEDFFASIVIFSQEAS
jgi:hypothetical protein